MTRNDRFFKILFAIQVALVPLIMAAYILMPKWTVGVFVGAALIVKIWLELFKNKEDLTHIRLLAVANLLTVASLVIFFAVYGYINVVLAVFIVILVCLMNIFKLTLINRVMPEMIEAIDSCYMMFECLFLAGLTFVVAYDLIATIALYALLLTSAVSVSYKLFYVWKQFGLWEKIKNLFRRK